MKKIFTIIFLATVSVASAQWSNTTNHFYDSLHMPACIADKNQQNPLVVTSYPDGGYFVIWEDDRNTATTKRDIYAQKYDKTGKRLWAVNGVPVVNGPNDQHYVWSSNEDYRSRSFVATDSAGGFYISYVDDSISTYDWQRMCVQHMKSNGSPVFKGAGYIVAQTEANQGYNFQMPQLVADGNKGFYIAYVNNYGNDYVLVYNYKDVNGIMNFYGGGKVNENAVETFGLGPCGIRTDVIYPGTNVIDYNIWPDNQGGCNVIMSMNGNIGSQYKMLCYNRVWRAKKDAKVRTYYRNETGVTCPRITQYTNGQVYILYTVSKDFMNVACGGGTGPLYEYTNYRLLSNGYQLIDEGGYDYNYPKGVNLTTQGNITVNVMTVTKRTYLDNTVSAFTVQGYGYPEESYDSVPYQRAAFSDPDIGYNPTPPGSYDDFTYFRDTLLATDNYYADFSIAGSGSEFYATALMGNSGNRLVRLQHMKLNKKSANAYALEYTTSTKYGVPVGKEVSTGYGGSSISFDLPLVTIDSKGTALFYIREYYRSARVSPIINGTQLAWGAMGKPINNGILNNGLGNLEKPFVTLNPSDGSGVITWEDNSNIPGVTGENIFIRHLDSLNKNGYMPPEKPVSLIPNPYGGTLCNPAVMLGSSKNYSTIDAYAYYAPLQPTTPVIQILDNNNLGVVGVSIFQNTGAIRKYNNQPYLDRNFTIETENTPVGVKNNLRLFFTKTEFDALKASDNSIKNPGDLVVVVQPNNTLNAPVAFTALGGEQQISPIAWDSLANGYYVEIETTAFGNFFIQKNTNIPLCPGGNTTLSSNTTGTTYQWQMSTGGGFTNITNNSKYSGAQTINLQLTGIPSSWYGYGYRCVVDGTAGNVFYLRFLNTWTGAVNSSWEDAGNWSCGVVPDANTDVVINSGAVGINSDITVRSLTVNPGVLFVVNPGYKVTVTH